MNDASFQLKKGFGVEVVDRRGDKALTSEGRWFPLPALERVVVASTAVVSAPRAPVVPEGLLQDERWVDVDIAAQRVTAYQGSRAVRSMRASTGVGEDGAPYSTPRGGFRIYAKLRSAVMSSDKDDPRPYRFEAVPHVQYFNREVALHGAYWHRRFGERITHGCVNLAPDDAAWLFEFTGPRLLPSEKELAATRAPMGTSGAGKVGTYVRVR